MFTFTLLSSWFSYAANFVNDKISIENIYDRFCHYHKKFKNRRKKSRSIPPGFPTFIYYFFCFLYSYPVSNWLYRSTIPCALLFSSCRRLSGLSTSILLPWLNSHMRIPLPYTSALIVHTCSSCSIICAVGSRSNNGSGVSP